MSGHNVGRSVGLVTVFVALAGTPVLVAGVARGGPPGAGPGAAPGASFEDLLRAAVAAPEADALVAPFAQDCDKSRREIDRARCRGTQSFLRAKLPQETMHAVVDSTRVVSVSPYDAGVHGLRVRLLGCLTCDDPAIGPEGEAHYVTLAVPGKQSESLREGVILAETTVAVSDPAAARAFEANVKPHLRAEFVFRGNGTPWTRKAERGVAFAPVAMRIFNRCTGDVLYSQPASAGRVNVVEGLKGCPAEAALASEDSARKKEETEEAPEKLGATELSQVLHRANAAITACDSQYKMPGLLDLEFDLNRAGGSPQAVRAKGNLGGTAVANCLMQAVRSAQFPPFQQAKQTFSYQVRLAGGK